MRNGTVSEIAGQGWRGVPDCGCAAVGKAPGIAGVEAEQAVPCGEMAPRAKQRRALQADMLSARPCHGRERTRSKLANGHAGACQQGRDP